MILRHEEKMQRRIAYAYARCLVGIYRQKEKKKELRGHISPNILKKGKKTTKNYTNTNINTTT